MPLLQPQLKKTPPCRRQQSLVRILVDRRRDRCLLALFRTDAALSLLLIERFTHVNRNTKVLKTMARLALLCIV
jgi:hypothetical protein